MLHDILKIGCRRLWRNKVLTLLNILGVATGISAFVFITHYIGFELSYDEFHENKQHIYRVGSERYSNGVLVETSAKTFPGVRALLKDHFPEVKDVTGFYKTPANTGFLFRKDGMIYNEAGGWLNADSSFFKVFPSLLLKGDSEAVLDEPNSLILSETIARKLFGDADPVGQILNRIDDYASGDNYTVRGVLKDIPSNSHFHASIIEHIYDSWPESDIELWGEGRLSTYVSFSETIELDVIEAKLNSLLQHIAKQDTFLMQYKVFLQPITKIHLNSLSRDELEAAGNESLLYLLGAIGLAIMLMAWINYVNLQTSGFVFRMKEYGIRRIVGSGKRALFLQFLVEYSVLTVAALLVAVVMVTVLSPTYSTLTGVQALFTGDVKAWGSALAFLLCGSVVVGVYPAIFFLKFDPVLALKGKVGSRRSGSKIGQLLVIVQFTTSITLLALVFTAHQQLTFMKTLDKGVELESVVAIRNPTAYSDQELPAKHVEFETMLNKMMQYPGVRSVASSSAIPGTEIGFNYVDLVKRNLGDPYDATVFKTLFVSSGFIPTYNLDLVAGMNFSIPGNYDGESPWETENWSSVILNERAIYHLGFRSPDEAVGQEIWFQPFDDFIKCKIIGIIKDYHHEAVKKAVFPTVLFHNYNTYQQVFYSVGLNPGVNTSDALSRIESVWKESFPDKPFEYFFLDEYYHRQFMSELQSQKVFTVFAGIAVLIACLGVLGMTLFGMNMRLKEICIRKTLGASVAGLAMLLSRTNLRLILISGAVAAPLIYYLVGEWLSGYPARIEFTPMLTFGPLVIVASMVFVVSGIHTLRAALKNPTEHLRGD